MKTLRFAFILFLFLSVTLKADVVKPALVEINIYTDGYYQVEIRASIEALLTGINSQFKDTKQSPNAKHYDSLREMPPAALLNEFDKFRNHFISTIELKLDGKKALLKIQKVEVPPRGYTKIPRISLIVLRGKINRSVKTIQWYYPSSFADNAVRVRQVDLKKEKWHWSNWQWLKNDKASTPFSITEIFTKETTASIVKTYTLAGYKHIFPKGFDHILFILGIFFLSTKLRPLLWQVTMFTIAHSITLSLAILNIFTLPSNIVEPLIALSIAYIGIENVLTKKIKPRRLVIIFIFGLLHGMGFASMLTDFGMPSEDFGIALISFNIGVEFGQLSIILIAFLLIGYWFRNKVWYQNAIVVPASIIISFIGLYWTYDRIIF